MKSELYYGFDKPLDRNKTESIKWELPRKSENEHAIPMWVADMDFRTASCVIDALKSRTEHGAFGYSSGEETDKAALINWLKRRHNCNIEQNNILFSPGVVDSIYHILRALLKKGDSVIIQPPVYGPFKAMIEKAGMKAVKNPLKINNNRYEPDFEGLEAALKKGAKALLICSPHNPVGRIWSKSELETTAYLCKKYNVLLLCDEIHADIELDGNRHTSIITVKAAENAIMLVSATKTFNLAALRHSAIICRDDQILAKINERLNEVMADINLYGRLATRAAYLNGDKWLDALNEYISDGKKIFMNRINNIPGLSSTNTEGTYLNWLDAKELGMDDEKLYSFFVNECGIIPSRGTDFGTEGSGFLRINLATTHANIIKAAENIERAVSKLENNRL